MQAWAFGLAAADLVTGALLGLLLAIGVLLIVRKYRRRPTPEELERRRRSALAATGKMGDAWLVDIQGMVLIYSYDVRGVRYTASQDAAPIQPLLPSDMSFAIGAVLVKYDSRNPANSILVSEAWSGLKVNHHVM